MIDPEQRTEETRHEVHAAFDRLVPGIRGNPFLPHWPLPAQAVFLGLHNLQGDDSEVFQALYGGAAGGGKSDALLMAQAQYAWGNPDYSGICFRRTFVDLTQPGALLDRALEWWIPRGVEWHAKTSTMRFPGGGRVVFAYLKDPNDHLKYQGAEYHASCWDELTQWPDERQFNYVVQSRTRRKAGSTIPLRGLAASNPGGPGHAWVERQFVGAESPQTGRFEAARHPYVPARIKDNPYLDRDAYVRSLEHLHPTTRAQLLEGDWSARDAGDYFRREWFGTLLDPEDAWPSVDCHRVRWWDLAASEKIEAKRTAGVRMARHRRGVYAIEHAIAFRKTPGARDAAIVQQAEIDGHEVTVGLEIEGGSGGPAQFESLAERLKRKGFRVVGARPRAEQTDREAVHIYRTPSTERGKQARAEPVASCLERGFQMRGECPDRGEPWWGEAIDQPVAAQRDGIRIYHGPWTREYLDEIEGFPELPLMDLVDATSGAWAWLKSHGVGAPKPLPGKPKKPHASPDVTPEERGDDEPGDRGRGGLWRA